MCIGTSGKDKDKTWVWLAWPFHASETAVLCRGTKHADKHAMFKSLSLGREHYRRLASTVCRCRHLTAEEIQLHAHEDKKKQQIALQKSLHKKDKQDISRKLK